MFTCKYSTAKETSRKYDIWAFTTMYNHQFWLKLGRNNGYYMKPTVHFSAHLRESWNIYWIKNCFFNKGCRKNRNTLHVYYSFSVSLNIFNVIKQKRFLFCVFSLIENLWGWLHHSSALVLCNLWKSIRARILKQKI